MHVIDQRWGRLHAGYSRVAELEAQLESEWTSRLAVAAQRKAALMDAERRKQTVLLWVLVLSLLGSLTIVLACLTVPLAIVASILHSNCQQRIRELGATPSMGLLPRWWQSIAQPQHQWITKHGDLGEMDLLRRLQSVLPDTYLAIRNLPVAKGLDADVLLLAPNGVWILESKFWSGEISYRNGVWFRYKQYYAPGGIPEWRHDEASRAFHTQWLRERENLERTISLRVPAHAWVSTLIKGGLVFTHPSVLLDIDPDCPVACGYTDYWLDTLVGDSDTGSLSTSTQLEVLDAQLDYAESLRPLDRRSALDLSQRIYRDTQSELEHYEASP